MYVVCLLCGIYSILYVLYVWYDIMCGVCMWYVCDMYDLYTFLVWIVGACARLWYGFVVYMIIFCVHGMYV